MEIGNLGPGEEVKINISYLQELNVEQNTFYQLHIPSTISPRYMNELSWKHYVDNHKKIKSKYTWNFKIKILTYRQLTYYMSLSHNLHLISQNDAKT